MAVGHTYHFGPFTLDAGRRRLYRGNEPLALTPKALDMLLLFVQRPGEVIEKDYLIQRLWPDVVVEESNLTQHVFTLRKVLGERAGDSRYIATVPRRGYRFISEVRIEGEARPAWPAHDGSRAERRTQRFSIELPADAPAARLNVPVMALSPDGDELVYVARCGAETALFRRPMAELAAERIPGTDGAVGPFWSPDGNWIGFVCGGWLRRVSRYGGVLHTIAEAGDCRGASWSVRGEIVYAPGPAEGLWIVSAEGGRARRLTSVDFAAGERTHRWPACLPDGRTALFTAGSAGIASFDEAAISIVSLETGERRLLIDRATDPRWDDAGVLLFTRESVVHAAAFDVATLSLRDAPVSAVNGVMTESTGIAHFACSAAGPLIYMAGGPADVRRELRWIDEAGTSSPVPAPSGEIEEPRLSPDGMRVALGARAGTSDIWIIELARGVVSRLTASDDNFAPIWTPDGDRITFSSNRSGPANLFWKRADGAGDEERLVFSEFDLVPGSWSPGGRTLLYTEYHPVTGADIWAADPLHGGAPRSILRTRFNEYAPMWSPDGGWFVYTSDESGAAQVYLRRFPDGPRIQISVDGGSEALWSRDGARIWFRSGARLFAVDVALDAREPRASAPYPCAPHASQPGTSTGLPNFDIALDGRRVLAVVAPPAPPDVRSFAVTLEWLPVMSELRKSGARVRRSIDVAD